MKIVLTTLAISAGLLSNTLFAQGSEVLTVYASNGVRVVLEELQPRIEQIIGKPLSFEMSTSRTLVERIEAGEAFDVALLTPGLIDGLIASGNVKLNTRNTFSQVGIGVGSREGTQAKSVATLDDLRDTFLDAESIAFGANGQSRVTNEASFETLGIAEQMRGKTRLTGAGEAPGLVEHGEIELVLSLVSELLRHPGVQYLGPLPAEVQGYVQFASGLSAGTEDATTAQSFIAFLSAPEFRTVLEKHGLEAISR
jgi:molybdate transport system substrate-binding protein